MTKFIELPLRVQGYVPRTQFMPHHASASVLAELYGVRNEFTETYRQMINELNAGKFETDYAVSKMLKPRLKGIKLKIEAIQTKYKLDDDTFKSISEPIIEDIEKLFTDVPKPTFTRKTFVIEVKNNDERKAADEVLSRIENIVEGFLESNIMLNQPESFNSENDKTERIEWLKREERNVFGKLDEIKKNRPNALTPEQIDALIHGSEAMKDFEKEVAAQMKLLKDTPIIVELEQAAEEARTRRRRRPIYSRRR